jgi:phosphonate transport system ATP-binding protein
MMILDAVSVQYSHLAALQAVSLRLKRGEITVLLGSSGAGKSTLLRCLNGLVAPTTGRVLAEGAGDMADERRRRALRRRTGMIFQSHQLIGRLTALANVQKGRLGYHSTLRSLFPASAKELRLALHCLDRVGLLDKAQIRADRLSGGERQRVGIARALVQEPELLLADEPVASLDPASALRVLSLLHRICREDGLTAVISLHQVDLARRFADRIVGLRQGRIIFDGSPPSLTDQELMNLYGKPAPLGSPASLKEVL